MFKKYKYKLLPYLLSILIIGCFLVFIAIYLPSHSFYIDYKSQVAVVGSVDVFATGFRTLLNEQRNNILTLPKLSTNYGNTIIDLTRKQGVTVKNVREMYSVDLNNFAPTNYLNTSMAFFADVDDEDVIVTWVEENKLYIGERNQVKPGPSMERAFSNTDYQAIEAEKLNSITLVNFNTYKATTMNRMFAKTGYLSTSFTLELGNHFHTSNVTNMSEMFRNVAKASTAFTLNLGNHFNAVKVTDVENMFYNAGYSSPVFNLDMGPNFNGSNITNTVSMFYQTGYSSNAFTLNLGNFNPVNVTNMAGMFQDTGFSSAVFNLDLGPVFDVTNVTNMALMFYNTGQSSNVFTFNLGNFNPINVTDMYGMFSYTGADSPVFNLNLGPNFNTSKVTNMVYMFHNVGRNTTSFSLNLGSHFDTSNVLNMAFIFSRVAYNSDTFTLNLGSKFNTAKVANIHQAFANTCYSCTDYTLDLEQIVINNINVKPGQFANQSGATNIIFGSGFSVMALNDYTFLRKKPVNVYYTDPNFLTWPIGQTSRWTTWRGSGNTTFISGRPA